MADYTETERRILDMWPKFEDGAYVMLGDEVSYDHDESAREGSVSAVCFPSKRPFKYTFALEVEDNGSVSVARYIIGSKVRRPEPKVLDADGVEIKVGDRVYSINNGNGYIVRAINGNGTLEFKGFDDRGWVPRFFTHKLPIIDADYMPIKVGDTVYEANGQDGIVTAVHPSTGCVDLRQGDCDAYAMDCLRLSHVQPDSWERLEEDADRGPTGGMDYEEFARDLVRRAKALAEREAAR